MASKSNESSQTSRENSNPSYAHAVLNFKNTDSNKENINDTALPAPKELPVKEVTARSKYSYQKSARQNSHATHGSSSSDDYTPIIGNSRNVRKSPEKCDTNCKPVQNGPINGSCQDGQMSDSKLNENDDCNGDPEKEPEKIKYVEAPLPKVNPWTVNKNAALVITGKHETSPMSTQTVPTEKRVLQPQQQGRIGKFYFYKWSILVHFYVWINFP